MAYRPDIDGLRALAVLAVVVYHAFPGLAPGGFTGVDVFFVISGFLITEILLRSLRDDRFSLAAFYARRARRLLPALSLVLGTTLVAGYWLLPPDAYLQLGRHAVAAVAFVPNLLFWREAGYFDVAAARKPLLHLWSLGVEEQFYLAWPLLLALLWRARLPPGAIVAAIVGASFAACLVLLGRDPTGAFFLPHARIWELAIGGLVATTGATARLAARPLPWRQACSLAGLGLLLLSTFGIDAADPFPGVNALLPTVGAALLLLAGPGTWIARQVLARGPAVWLGRISYPLYLWHWPLLSIAVILAPGDVPASVRALLVIAAVVLAWLTWRIVETPVRRGAPRAWKVALPVTAMIAVLALAVAVVRSNGAAGRVAEEIRHYATHQDDSYADARAGECWLGAYMPVDGYADDCVDADAALSRSLVVVWGDSHAALLAVGVREVAGDRRRVAQFTRDGCQPLFEIKYLRCIEANAWVLERIRALRPAVVVLFSHWASPALPDGTHTLDALDATVTDVLAAGAGRVVVIGPAPLWNGRKATLPANLVELHAVRPYLVAPMRTWFGLDHAPWALDTRYARRFAGRRGVVYVSALRAMCDLRGCLTRTGDDPRDLTTWDYGHLTKSGAIHVARVVDAATAGFSATTPLPPPPSAADNADAVDETE